MFVPTGPGETTHPEELPGDQTNHPGFLESLGLSISNYFFPKKLE